MIVMVMDLRKRKRRLRRQVLSARDALGVDEITSRSQRLHRNLEILAEYQAARTVHLFASFGTEVDTRPLLESLWARGTRTVLPRVAPDGQLEHCVVQGFTELLAGFRDIPEPAPSCGRWLPDEVDLILVPGVAFDRAGGRLGYGGGYYDRFLSACPAPRVALAFHLQVVDHVPREPHDLRVHRIVTEEAVIEVVPPETGAPAGSV
jgi:5-formyltetrahydrofolate cyclo-ligase